MRRPAWKGVLSQARLHLRRKSAIKRMKLQLLIDKSDDANFINFCTGKTLTNGLQVRQGSCNGIRKL